MNDDAIFLVVFFCTAALSGLWSSLDDRLPSNSAKALQAPPQAATAPAADYSEHRAYPQGNGSGRAQRAPRPL